MEIFLEGYSPSKFWKNFSRDGPHTGSCEILALQPPFGISSIFLHGARPRSSGRGFAVLYCSIKRDCYHFNGCGLHCYYFVTNCFRDTRPLWSAWALSAGGSRQPAAPDPEAVSLRSTSVSNADSLFSPIFSPVFSLYTP